MKNNKGFTLIELLVVIAIIGLLSSVVLASLNSARLKARDAAIKEGAHQMRSLLEQEYSNSGNYANLEMGWMNDSTSLCNSEPWGGAYAQNAKAICNSIVQSAGSGTYTLYINFPAGTNSSKYTILAYLPYKNRYYCIGSNGANSDYDIGDWVSPGCYSNTDLINS